MCWRDYLTRRQQFSLPGSSSQPPSDKQDGSALYMASWAQQDFFLSEGFPFPYPKSLIDEEVLISGFSIHLIIILISFLPAKHTSPCHFILPHSSSIIPDWWDLCEQVSRLSGQPQRPFRNLDAFKPFHTVIS